MYVYVKPYSYTHGAIYEASGWVLNTYACL